MVTAPTPVTAKIDEAAPAANGVTTTVVPEGDGDAAYSMLESTELSTDGGFLGGNLFFEVDEEFTVQFSRSGADSLRVRVRVVEIERGDEPGMWVEFIGVDDAARKQLAELLDSK